MNQAVTGALSAPVSAELTTTSSPAEPAHELAHEQSVSTLLSAVDAQEALPEVSSPPPTEVGQADEFKEAKTDNATVNETPVKKPASDTVSTPEPQQQQQQQKQPSPQQQQQQQQPQQKQQSPQQQPPKLTPSLGKVSSLQLSFVVVF